MVKYFPLFIVGIPRLPLIQKLVEKLGFGISLGSESLKDCTIGSYSTEETTSFTVKHELSLERQLAISGAFGRFFSSCDLGQWGVILANFNELVRTLKFCYRVKTLEEACQYELFLTDEQHLFITSGKRKPEFKPFKRRPELYEDIPLVAVGPIAKPKKKRKS